MPKYWMRKIKTSVVTYEVYSTPQNSSVKWAVQDGKMLRSTRVGKPEVEIIEDLREMTEPETALIQSVIVTPENDDD